MFFNILFFFILHYPSNLSFLQGDSPKCEESSSGISSNNNSARRPSMTLNMLSSNRKPTNAISAEKRHLEIQYSTKKMRYTNLKKTLAEKQVKRIFIC